MLSKRKFIKRVLPSAPLLFAALALALPSSATANTVLTVQAENAAQTTGSGWSTENQLSGFSGSGYIVWRGADDFRATDAQPPAGIKAYDFRVTQAGTYEFAARVQARVGNGSAASDKDNDAWMKFTSGSATQGVQGDASKWTKFFVGGADESWKNYTNGEQFDPTFKTEIKRDLSVGTHRILVGGRSARFAIDNVSLELVSSSGGGSQPEPVTTPELIPSQPVAEACTATGANLTSARNEYANNCPGIPRQDCDPLSGGSWVCSSGTIDGSASAPTVPSVPTEPSEPSVPSEPTQPSTPVASGVCTATGSSLAQARDNFATACPNIPREDCDPLSSGGWSCSSENIGGVAATPVVPVEPVEPVEPVTPVIPSTPVAGDICTASGSSLAQAQQNFASSCPTLARQDCDPVSGGGWTCSSGVIGDNAPGGTPVVSSPTSNPGDAPSSSDGGTTGLIGSNDLLVLHYDNCPDRDDGHAIVANQAVVDAAGLQNVLVVNGTCGAAIRNRYQADSVEVLRAVFGNNWLDGFNQQTQSVNTSADRWAATLANGNDVWVAEGGPSDFTAEVLRRLGSVYPSVNRKRIRVVQHSSGGSFNEKNTLTANINLVKQVADYIAIADGNFANNGTADFNEKSSSFVNIALQSRYGSEWAVAFDYLSPDDKLDFSDTVELLYIIGDTQTMDAGDFADRYLR